MYSNTSMSKPHAMFKTILAYFVKAVRSIILASLVLLVNAYKRVPCVNDIKYLFDTQ